MYILIIDTNKYAGNFERELCAWCTGIIGQCTVGEEFAAEFPNPETFEDIIAQVPDRHGCSRPVAIQPNKRNKYNSVGIFFDAKPTTEQINIIKERAQLFLTDNKAKNLCKKRFVDNKFKILGFRLVERTTQEFEIEM